MLGASALLVVATAGCGGSESGRDGDRRQRARTYAVLGHDPESRGSADWWLSVSGPGMRKSLGDRYLARGCRSSDTACIGGRINDEFDPDGYHFEVRVRTGDPEGDLRIEAFDPATVSVGDRCERALPGDDEIEALEEFYPDAASRYHRGAGRWCTGDRSYPDGAAEDRLTRTNFTVLAPDDTPGNPRDNPAVDTPGCRPVTMGAYHEDGPSVFELLHPGDGVRDDEAVVADDGEWTFAEVFRRWVPLCRIPAAEVTPGTYLVQVRSAGPDRGAPLEGTVEGDHGLNRFSLRATVGPPGGVELAEQPHLPTFVNGPVAEPRYDLVQVTPERLGSTLRIEAFDLDPPDSRRRHGPSVTIGSSGDSSVPLKGCTAAIEWRSAVELEMDDCVIDTSRSGEMTDGRVIRIDVPIPADWDCGSTEDCWIRAMVPYTGPDGITWSLSWTDPPAGSGSAGTRVPTTTPRSTAPTSAPPRVGDLVNVRPADRTGPHGPFGADPPRGSTPPRNG